MSAVSPVFLTPLFSLPAISGEPGDSFEPEVPCSPRTLWEKGLARFHSHLHAAETTALAACAIFPSKTFPPKSIKVEELTKALSCVLREKPTSKMEEEEAYPAAYLWAQAQQALLTQDYARAISLLLPLLYLVDAKGHLNDHTPLALSLCALATNRLEEAWTLAQEGLARGSRHPRLYAILGLCERWKGAKIEAQSHLAIAARLARTHPDYAQDLRFVQKILLDMHFDPTGGLDRWSFL